MMNVAIKSPELERFVQEKIAGGIYRSPEEVIAAGLLMLQHDPDADIPPQELEELRREIQVGIVELDKGDHSSWTAESMKAKLRSSLNNGER
jgi:antitoxin ParD1/3/4